MARHVEGRGGAWLDLHDHSCGSAMLAVSWWLAEVVPKQLTRLRETRNDIVRGYHRLGKKSRMPWQPTGSELQVSVQQTLG